MAVEPGEIELEDHGARGRYVFRAPEGEAEMTFTRAGERLIIIDHTGVPEALAGRGVGVAMVTRAVQDARAAGIRILPLCPFAAAQFRRRPEWADVLDRA